MNLRISQFTQATTLDSSDLIPIVNEQVTKQTTLASVTAISTKYTSETFLPLTGGIITGDLGITNSLTASNAQVLNTLTVVGTVSTASHGTSREWGNSSTLVAAKSALWSGGSTIVQANSANWQSTHTTVKSNSSRWESAYDILDANAYKWGSGITGPGIFGYIPKYTDLTTIGNSVIFENTAGNVGIGTTAPIPAKLTVKGSIMADGNLDISGFTTLSSAWIKGNLRIDGTLSSLGPEVKIDTMTAFTTALQINNTGIGPALRVTQAGAQNVATFSDENGTIMCITDKGNVGIGGSNPCNTDASVKLQVTGPTKLGTTVIRDWDNTTDSATIANIRPGSGASSDFGSIIEGRESGHILIGINSNDSQDGFSVVSKSYPSAPVLPATGYYLRNCFTVMNTGNVGIGIQYPLAARLDILSETIDQPIINLRPPSGTFGNRSILSFWSTFASATNGDTGARRSADIVSGFNTGNWGNQYLAFHIGNDNAANDSAKLNREKVRITSNCHVGIGETDPLRRLHISNNLASEMIIEQTDAKADYRKWNLVVDGGATTGGGVPSRFYIRQLNDAATSGNIPFFINGDGRIGINNNTVLPGAHLHVNGDAIFGASITTGYNVSTGDCPINLGALRSGDGNTYIDFHAQDRHPGAIDFDARLIRSGGANGEFGLVNIGTGLMTLKQTGAASMIFQTDSEERMAITANGNVGINTAGVTLYEKLHVAGNILVGTNGNNVAVQDSNYIRFAGTYNDAGTARFHTFIAERRYVTNTEKSELLIAKGNDPHTPASGPDRIRLLGGAIAFDTYNSSVDTTSVESMASGGDTTMYIMPTGVGIGDAFPTSNPVTLLHLNRSNYAAIQLGNNNSTGFTIAKESSDNSFGIWTGAIGAGTNRLKILTDGKVGINCIPDTQLHVNGIVTIGKSDISTVNTYGGILSFNGGNSTDYMGISRYNVAADSTELRVHIGDNGGAAGAGTDAFVVGEGAPTATFTELFKVRSDGSVHARGPIFANGSRINMTADGLGMSWLCSTGTNAEVAAGNAGRAAIGFHVTNTATGACDYVQCMKLLRCSDDIIAFWTSDYRLKTNIVNIPNSLQKITELRGVNFIWNDELQTTHTGEDVGVIAQDVERVIPTAVTTRENGYKAVNYEKIVPLLIEAIKELKAEVDMLKSVLNK